MTVARPRLPRRRWERPDRAAVDLRTRVGEVTLANPVMTASGTAGHGAELGGYVDLAGLGAVVVKSVSADPWPGNPPPRLYSVEGGMLNSVGLQNPGGGHLAGRGPPAAAGRRRHRGRPASGVRRAVGATSGWRPSWPRRRQPGVAVEANISCPNIEDRSRMFAHSAGGRRAPPSARRLRGLAGSRPLWAKLSPNVTDLPELAAAAIDAGADARHLDQHGDGPGPRPRDGSRPPGCGRRGTVRPGDPPGRGAGRVRVPGRPCRRCRSSGWAGVTTGGETQPSCWRPAPTPCRSAPPPSPIRGRPARVLAELTTGAPSTESPPSTT